jgi:hypothetical protein
MYTANNICQFKCLKLEVGDLCPSYAVAGCCRMSDRRGQELIFVAALDSGSRGHIGNTTFGSFTPPRVINIFWAFQTLLDVAKSGKF